MGGPTAKKYKFNRQEVVNDKSVRDKNAVLNLDGHVAIASCFFLKKAAKLVQYQ